MTSVRLPRAALTPVDKIPLHAVTPVTYDMAVPRPLALHPDRLFPADPGVRAIARCLYAHVRDLPILSPHGHTDPAWFAYDQPFGELSPRQVASAHRAPSRSVMRLKAGRLVILAA
jgi:hypothetical protein